MDATTTINPPENAEPAAPGVAAVIQVNAGQWADALTAFFTALAVDGVTSVNTYATGFKVTDEGMDVLLCQRVPDVDPVATGDGEFDEWTWPIRIEVLR